MPVEFGKATRRWKSNQRFETMVREFLVTFPHSFENHMVDGTDEERFIPRMEETIPGQFNNSNHGIDIFGFDVGGRLWVIEISEGKVEGAGRFKGGGADVIYAGNNKQMSREWRDAATERFLTRNPNAIAMIRNLLGMRTTTLNAGVTAYFRQLYARHRPAIILPEGGHFDTTGTDIAFVSQVYTVPVSLRH